MPMFKRSMMILVALTAITLAATAALVTGEEAEVLQPAPLSPKRPKTVTVYVAGAVNKPSVVTLSAGERVITAVEKCGGVLPTANIEAVNMAEVLRDGMSIIVPEHKEREAVASDERSYGRASRDNLVSINNADAKELDTLPGIGPAIAKRIIDYRTEKGGFKSIDELKEVRGIGDAKYERLRDKIKL